MPKNKYSRNLISVKLTVYPESYNDKKPFSRQLTAIGLLAILNPVTHAEGEPSQLFEPAEQDAKGRFINLDKEHSKASIRVTAPFFMRRVASSLFSHAGAPKRIANDGA